MDIRKVNRVLKLLEEAKMKTAIILARLKLVIKIAITKTNPIPFTLEGLINLILLCKQSTLELSYFDILKRSGIWSWCFEYFDLILLQIKSKCFMQEVLIGLCNLCRGFAHLLQSIDDTIFKIRSQLSHRTQCYV